MINPRDQYRTVWTVIASVSAGLILSVIASFLSSASVSNRTADMATRNEQRITRLEQIVTEQYSEIIQRLARIEGAK